MNTLTKSVILGFAIAGHSAAVAAQKGPYKSYKIIGSSTCEAENMHTITDIDECSTAGAALGQRNYRQKDGSALGRGIYTTKGTGRTKGCTFHGGVIEETGGVYRYSSSIDINDGRRGIQLFPLASGSCGSANFWCICGISEAPQHKKRGHYHGSGSGHPEFGMDDSSFKMPQKREEGKSERQGHDHGSGSGSGHGRGSHVKSPLPQHKKSEGGGHYRGSGSDHGSGSGSGHGRGSHVKSPLPQHKKSEGEGHDHSSGSGHPEFERASEGVSAPTVALIGVAGFLAGIFSTFLVARCRSRSRRSNKGPTCLSADAVTPITNPATPKIFTTIPAGSAAGTVAVAVVDKV